MILAGGLLVALALPALHMKTVISGVDDLPQDIAVLETYDKVKTAFPREGVTTVVAVEANDVRAGDVATQIAALRHALSEIAGEFRRLAPTAFSEWLSFSAVEGVMGRGAARQPLQGRCSPLALQP
jgi:uncharacterized membrane protein YdfJ with MMPL/SSD domain